MKLNLKNGQDNLELGDPIVISYSSGLTMGIFAGTGKGTIQYYMARHIYSRKQLCDERGKKPNFYKAYVHGAATPYRVMKIDRNVMTEKELEEYEKAIEILKQENIIR